MSHTYFISTASLELALFVMENPMMKAKITSPDSPPTIIYAQHRILPDQRCLSVYFNSTENGGENYAGIGDGLKVTICPSRRNPVGFLTTECFFNGPADYIRYHADKGLTLINLPKRQKSMIDRRRNVQIAYGLLSETDLAELKKKYETLISQTVRVLEGDRRNITLV